MNGSYLGPSYDDETIKIELNNLGAKYEFKDEENLLEVVAENLSKNKTVGWFEGRMEFGPRALGARSIIADPRSDKMQKELNLKVKFERVFDHLSINIKRRFK